MFIHPTPPSSPIAHSKKKNPEPESQGGLVRDVLALGAGASAGVGGGVVGLGTGLAKGARENYPAHVKKGAGLGKSGVGQFGRVAGATAAAATVAAATVLSPVVAAASAVGGFGRGTLKGASKVLPQQVKPAARVGARWAKSALGFVGKVAGSLVGGVVGGVLTIPTLLSPRAGLLIIPAASVAGSQVGGATGRLVGGLVGKVVGGTLGAVVGGAVSLVKGLPEGFRGGVNGAREGAKVLTSLPAFAKQTWKVGTEGGEAILGTVGQIVGGTAGALTGTVETLGDGLRGSATTAQRWAIDAHESAK